MKQNVAVIEFGTGTITALVGSRGLNDTINLDGISVCDYDGHVGGIWVKPENLAYSIKTALTKLGESVIRKIDKWYVGVPGDFLTCDVKNVVLTFDKRRRVTETDLENLNVMGNTYYDDKEYKVVNIQPIYYMIDDDNNNKYASALGKTTTLLTGCLSYMRARREFIELVDGAIKRLGIPEIDFVATPLAEMLYLFEDYKRDHFVMLADVGTLATTLSLGRGDGLCRVYNFPWGGARITKALADGLNIDLSEAERLKRKVVLTLDPAYEPQSEPSIDNADYDPLAKDEDNISHQIHITHTEYVVEINGERHTYPITMTNEIVINELNKFCKYVEKTFSICDYEYPEFIALSITGGGLVNIRGAIEYVKERLGRDVEIKTSKQPLLNGKPNLTSALGLMDYIFLSGEMPNEGIIERIKRFFIRR